MDIETIFFLILALGSYLVQTWSKNRKEAELRAEPDWLDLEEEQPRLKARRKNAKRNGAKPPPSPVAPVRVKTLAESLSEGAENEVLSRAKPLAVRKRKKRASSGLKQDLRRGRYSSTDVRKAMRINIVLDKPKSYDL